MHSVACRYVLHRKQLKTNYSASCIYSWKSRDVATLNYIWIKDILGSQKIIFDCILFFFVHSTTVTSSWPLWSRPLITSPPWRWPCLEGAAESQPTTGSETPTNQMDSGRDSLVRGRARESLVRGRARARRKRARRKFPCTSLSSKVTSLSWSGWSDCRTDTSLPNHRGECHKRDLLHMV